MLVYGERLLRELRWPTTLSTAPALMVVAWNEHDDLRWRRLRGDVVVGEDVSPDERRRALEAIVDFLRDPRRADEHLVLAELLRLPAWQHALETLDENLAKLPSTCGREVGGRHGSTGGATGVSRDAADQRRT